mmetsp:Transcript_19568/g.31136  ORF Transcript_19568/g.31136 Transcript_19568/m.31136 type:complete len:209 (+) Transcript_19568:459-1085(+)
MMSFTFSALATDGGRVSAASASSLALCCCSSWSALGARVLCHETCFLPFFVPCSPLDSAFGSALAMEVGFEVTLSGCIGDAGLSCSLSSSDSVGCGVAGITCSLPFSGSDGGGVVWLPCSLSVGGAVATLSCSLSSSDSVGGGVAWLPCLLCSSGSVVLGVAGLPCSSSLWGVDPKVVVSAVVAFLSFSVDANSDPTARIKLSMDTIK